LLRYCARPPFAPDRLRELYAKHLIYKRAKPIPGGTGPLHLAPLELLDRLAALVPPPVHRHRSFGVHARVATHGKFLRRPRTAGGGRYGKLSMVTDLDSSSQ
jgi:hypothetical protein